MWDLRLPSGLFFTILGGILVALGIFAPDMRAPLTDVNVNLYSGLSMLAFGAFLLLMARRASRKQP
jgi:ABC-type antimicrobial peptide transport system permease subunit